MEPTAKEELIQFILSLTEEECELIVSTIGDTRCTAPQEVMEFNATPFAQYGSNTGAFIV